MPKRNKCSPSYFLAMFSPKESTSDDNDSYNDFVTIARVAPHLSAFTKSFIVHMTYSRSTKCAVDYKRQVTLVLHGEIYGARDNEAEFLVERYSQLGLSFSQDINGSFAILVIDELNDCIALITDRVNTRRVFCSKHKKAYWLSTSLYLHPTVDTPLDAAGVACYLANGVIHNGRSLFDGIRVLERATIHELTREGVRATKYWFYEFTNSRSGADTRRLRAELSELLVQSVRVRLTDSPKIFLSLSGGYDATTILGILGARLNLQEVICFSYVYGKPIQGSDAYVSREMSNYLGFKHDIVQSYKGNLLDTLNRNANMGHGLANFCDEVDAWMELADQFSSKPSVLFVAEECFGWTDCQLLSNFDVLNSVYIFDFLGLGWLRGILSESVYRTLHDALAQEVSHILKRCPPTDDYHDVKDYLYLDQRMSNFLLPWREFFAGPFVTVRNPFLDNSILDFMMTIPSPLRRGKRLYIETVSEMFPELFRFPRATADSYVPDWRHEFSNKHHTLERLVLSQESKLDAIIPPQAILKIMQKNETWRHSKYSAKMLACKAARWLLNATPGGGKILVRFPQLSRVVTDPATVLKRVLVLRLFLSKVNTSLTEPAGSQSLLS